MKPAVSAFLQYATATQLPKRDKAALLVFSRLIAFQLPLPSSPVSNANEHYTDTLLSSVKGMVSELNESLVIDVAFLLESIRKVWLVRYELVYRPLSDNVQTLVSTILTLDDNAFSDELRTTAAELSVDSKLNNLVALCISALKVDVPPPVITQGENVPVIS